ncbi:hypothetical protein SOCEGT47_048060 [Sorangium cellulosum]|uniref:Secreted protein n=1 Tax=Sorangium cellulosum TaxID=56 RepID=A0A4P2Q4I8_SORCE|nr:hypothetical protein [Sorangium cellulosum]AUX24269.1 hypothetical protein SOCEGT47_048060 [Sorangium cellulosum]
MTRPRFATRFCAVLVALWLPVIACSAAGGGGEGNTTGGGEGGKSASGAGGSSSTTSSSDGSGDDFGLPGSDPESPPPADAGQPATCDDDGNCTCITIASIGHEGVWGPCSSDSTTALQNWLNTQSTAQVDNYNTEKPALTPEFLAKYDVILLQWMVTKGVQNDDGEPWQFTADEVNALEDWVNNGGGLIALSGYQCNGQGCTIHDVTATNQLLSFTDIQFNADSVLDPAQSACPNCNCWGGPVPVGGSLPGSVGTWNQDSPIGKNIQSVGAYVARSIRSTTATVDCTDGTNNFAVHEEVGKGHVVAYGDEWVTYSGQWLGTAACLNPQMYTDPNSPCYQRSAAQIFQISQFWYNALKYAASSVECFTIEDPVIIR